LLLAYYKSQFSCLQVFPDKNEKQLFSQFIIIIITK